MEATDKILNEHLRIAATACKIVDKTIETERRKTYIPTRADSAKLQSEPEKKELGEKDENTTLFTSATIATVLKRKEEENKQKRGNVVKQLKAQQIDEGIEIGE